jgi:hypothetical protein
LCLLIELETGETFALLSELAELALPLVAEEAHAHYIFSKFKIVLTHWTCGGIVSCASP